MLLRAQVPFVVRSVVLAQKAVGSLWNCAACSTWGDRLGVDPRLGLVMSNCDSTGRPCAWPAGSPPADRTAAAAAPAGPERLRARRHHRERADEKIAQEDEERIKREDAAWLKVESIAQEKNAHEDEERVMLQEATRLKVESNRQEKGFLHTAALEEAEELELRKQEEEKRQRYEGEMRRVPTAAVVNVLGNSASFNFESMAWVKHSTHALMDELDVYRKRLSNGTLAAGAVLRLQEDASDIADFVELVLNKPARAAVAGAFVASRPTCACHRHQRLV